MDRSNYGPGHRPPMIACTRVSPAGMVVVEHRRPDEEVKHWLEFNLRHRGGWALVVADEVRHFGWATSLDEVKRAVKQPRLVDRR